MDEETIDVAPSEENGNEPIDTPSEPETPAEDMETVATTEPETFELPDGRKVDAETLSREWKENFYPDYTRKSQALAAKTASETNIDTSTTENPYANPEYIPNSYEELLQVAEERALKAIEAKETQRTEATRAVEEAVSAQLTELRTADPSLNENALFLHANKYGFRDLKQAHQNMTDMRAQAKTVQQATAANIAKRNDPVSISPGATGGRPDASQFANARDYLRSLQT